MSRHDADLACAGRDDAGAVGADQAGFAPLQNRLDRDHVTDRNPFGDADRQADAGVDRFHDGVGRAGRRYEDHRDIGLGVSDRFGNGVENRDSFDVDATLAGGDSGHDAGAVFTALLGMEQAAPSGDPLDDNP